MAWSTRELADLAGTTVRAVRHYHRIGLLEEPRRRGNGYKQYGVTHLVRIVRIRRLAGLGFSLPQIAELVDADHHPREALRDLDTRLARDLEHLRRTRIEVRQILHQAVPTDLPPALAVRLRGVDLSDADHAMLVVLSRVLEPTVVTAVVDVLRAFPVDVATAAFDRLPPDADEPARVDLAMRLLPRYRAMRAMLPERWNGATSSRAAAVRTIDEAVRELYNPAQVDVLRRIRSAALREAAGRAAAGGR